MQGIPSCSHTTTISLVVGLSFTYCLHRYCSSPSGFCSVSSRAHQLSPMPHQPPGSCLDSLHKVMTTAFDVLYPPPQAPMPDLNAPADTPEGGPLTQVVCVYWCALSTSTMTPADVPLPQSLLASLTRPLPADLREPELVIPGFVSAHNATADGPPCSSVPPSLTTSWPLPRPSSTPPRPLHMLLQTRPPIFPSLSLTLSMRTVHVLFWYVHLMRPPLIMFPRLHLSNLLPLAWPRQLLPPPPFFLTSLHKAINLVHSAAMEAPECVLITALLHDVVAQACCCRPPRSCNRRPLN